MEVMEVPMQWHALHMPKSSPATTRSPFSNIDRKYYVQQPSSVWVHQEQSNVAARRAMSYVGHGRKYGDSRWLCSFIRKLTIFVVFSQLSSLGRHVDRRTQHSLILFGSLGAAVIPLSNTACIYLKGPGKHWRTSQGGAPGSPHWTPWPSA